MGTPASEEKGLTERTGCLDTTSKMMLLKRRANEVPGAGIVSGN